MYDTLTKAFTEAFEKFPIEEEIQKYNCETLTIKDLKHEMDWMLCAINDVKSPVVFTHNDYRSSNLLITEPNDELIVCDFDVSSYGRRGYDFVALMREFGPKVTGFGKPVDRFPVEDSVLEPLLEIYLKESQRIHGKSYSENPINSVENILKEVKVFYLFQKLWSISHIVSNDQNSEGGHPFNRKMCMVS